MKTGNFYRVLFLTILLPGVFFAKAQEAPKACGGYVIDTVALRKVLDYERSIKSTEKLETTSYLVRVYFHIGAFDDGSNQTIGIPQLTNELDTLIASYTSRNICFFNAGVDYINNTQIDTNFNADLNSATVFDPYRVPGCINIFYLQKIKGTNAACTGNCGYGGIALGGIPGTFCLVAASNIGKGQTISHEVGHCLGLYHTFENAFGYEDIDGSNASATGDLITDTPADAYAYNKQSCFLKSSDSCRYIGSCKDPKGASGFSSPYANLMAYWWLNGCYSGLTLTNGQYTRVIGDLVISFALQACESPSAVTLSGVTVSTGYYMQTAVNTLNTSGSVVLSGTTKATLGGGNVLLEPGFHAMPSAGGLLLIRIRPCN